MSSYSKGNSSSAQGSAAAGSGDNGADSGDDMDEDTMKQEAKGKPTKRAASKCTHPH